MDSIDDSVDQQAPLPPEGELELDRLTALEMLQFLKQYKKRELMYVYTINRLNKELQEKTLPSPVTVNSADRLLLDPAVNLEIRELRLKLAEREAEVQKLKNELRSATFTADSVMGLRLINKCRSLQEENADIGRMLLETQLLPLQQQVGILEKRLSFFKGQLLTLHEVNSELDRENQNLVRQVQELTRRLHGGTSPN